MQILEKGEYVGKINNGISGDGLLASVSSYQRERFNDSWHYHVNAHISFVLKGGRSEKKANRYECLPGKAMFYTAGEPHQIINMSNSTHVNLEIEDSFFQTYGISETGFVEMTRKNPDVLFTMLQVFKELQAADGCSTTSIQMLLLDFLHQAKNHDGMHKIPSWIIQIRDTLHDNWQGAVNLKDLSQAVDVHPVSISHYFPRYFSCTLGTYMRKLKIEHAISLLKSTDCLLTEVAYECGFFDQSHFIRTFKQLTGFLPAHYQKL